MSSEALPKISKSRDLFLVEVENWFKKLKSNYSKKSIQKIKKAFHFSDKAHEGQFRKSGEPYISHPFGVAKILSSMSLDTASVIIGLLHDTVEDTKITLEDIENEFGSKIKDLVNGVTKITRMNFRHSHHQQGENIRKMILYMGKDVRVILVKMVDRLYNMRTLKYLSPKSQERISKETLDIYIPLANRLGMESLKAEMEDLCFKHLQTNEYNSLVEQVNKSKEEREQYIKKIKNFLLKSIKKMVSFDFEISGRFKNYYSIYKKIITQNIDYNQIYDVIAFRICVNKIADCYECLGAVHSLWKPVPGRFKDFIAMPKKNQYQSLHTTMIGDTGEKIEVQIRTHKMHQIAEWGIYAHWKYKEGLEDSKLLDEDLLFEKFKWVGELISTHKHADNAEEFIENIKTDFTSSESEIYIFTPKGDVKELPKGATPIDFAYSIHTDVGNHMISAYIDGKLVAFQTPLQNGNTVKIETSKYQYPSKDWLKQCVTVRAKNRIRQYIKMEQRKRAHKIGYNLLEQEFQKLKLSQSKYLTENQLEKFKKENGCATLEEVYIRLGYGTIQPKKMIDALVPKEDLQSNSAKVISIKGNEEDLDKSIDTKRSSVILVDGVKNLLVHYAKCCSPIPGDNIVGFMSLKKGITIHLSNCKKIFGIDPNRKIHVAWSKNISSHILSNVRLKIICFNKRGLLKKISSIISEAGIDILSGDFNVLDSNNSCCIFNLSLRNSSQLSKAMTQLTQLQGVISVERILLY